MLAKIEQFVLWLYAHPEWLVPIILLIMVSAITEMAKRVFFIRWHSVRKKRAIYATSFVAAVMASTAGWLMLPGVVEDWEWIVCGLSLGSVANFLHWLTIKLLPCWLPTAKAKGL